MRTRALRSIAPALAALAAPLALAQNNIGDQIHKLVANDAGAEAALGWSVDMSGERVLVGAPGHNAAYVFDTTTREQTAKLQLEAGFPLGFGYAVGIDGDRAVVGQPFGNLHPEGVAYLFNAATGQQLGTIKAGDGAADDAFGIDVDVSGTIAIVGAPSANGNDGAAYLFDATTGEQLFKLQPADGGHQFGRSVALDGPFAIVGGFGTNGQGAAWIFEVANGQQLHELVPEGGGPNGEFGRTVGIHGALAIIGAPFDSVNGVNAGSAYVFNTITGQQISKLVASPGVMNDNFGDAVDITPTVAVVGTSGTDGQGTAYLFDPFSGTQLATLVAAGADDGFGRAVAAEGNLAAVGDFSDSDLGFFSGAAYLFLTADIEPDTDGDGLLDTWEINGIPYLTIDGQIEHLVLPGADPMHKNLYVELDRMATLSFSQDVVDDVEFAFLLAPVPNPDGVDGIDLHILVDDDDIPFEQVTQTPGNDFPASAGLTRFQFFGTDAERADPNALFLLGAKSLAFRYAIMYNKASTPIGGLAELGGDDMALFCGTYTDVSKGAVFMHELGHTLGLRHGGGDSINGKPNYPSIMNYVLAYQTSWNKTFWRLDYSRAELIAIDENDLSELDSVGVGGGGQYDEFFMPFYAVVANGAPCFDPDLFGQPIVSYADLDPAVLTDLNLDCDTNDDAFAGDLNFLDGSGLPGSVTPTPGQVLLGHNDWANLVLPVSDGGGAFAGTVPDDELTEDQVAFMEENFPPPANACAADINGDGELSILDFVAFQYAWQLQDPVADCNKDDAFNILDFVCYQQLFTKGCD